MGDESWKLGDDLCKQDNLLDGITFGDLILAVHCNCQKVTAKAVADEFVEILQQRLEDAKFLVKNNYDEIIAEAMKGRK